MEIIEIQFKAQRKEFFKNTKALFLRTYERLSKRGIAEGMRRKLKRKDLMHRIGWWIESLFYGGGS